MTCNLWRALRASDGIRDDAGAVAIEYALIAGIMSVAIVAGLIAIGGDLNLIFNNVAHGFTPTPAP